MYLWLFRSDHRLVQAQEQNSVLRQSIIAAIVQEAWSIVCVHTLVSLGTTDVQITACINILVYIEIIYNMNTN